MDRITLLVADDESIVRTFVRRYVREHGLPVSHIYEASNGREAVDLALAHCPDLILLDIRMPGINGLDAATAIVKKCPAACIVMVTAYDKFEYARSALRTGVADYLLKPLDPAALAERVRLVHEAKGKQPGDADEALARDIHPLVSQIRGYVDSHLNENLRLESIARAVHVSPSHCSRMFSKFTGVGISYFIAQRRMAKARELLENTYMSVTDITGCLGFSSSTYFASWFKNAAGISPLQYRKRKRAEREGGIF